MPVVFCQDSHSLLLCALGDLALENGLNILAALEIFCSSQSSRFGGKTHGVEIGGLVLLMASLASDTVSLNKLS